MKTGTSLYKSVYSSEDKEHSNLQNFGQKRNTTSRPLLRELLVHLITMVLARLFASTSTQLMYNSTIFPPIHPELLYLKFSTPLTHM